MPYFRVDDGFPSHPKVLAIPRKDRVAAIGLWTLAGAWCQHHLTDGRLAKYMVDELGSSKKYADLLVRVGLWVEDDQAYVFHEFVPWQGASREEVLAKREVEAERKRKWREAKAAQRAAGNANVLAVSQRDNHRTDTGTTASVRESSAPRPLLPSPSHTHPTPSHPDVPYGDIEDGSPWEGDVGQVDAGASNAPLPDEPPLCRRHAGQDRDSVPPCPACGRLREEWTAARADADRPPPWPAWCGDPTCDPATRLRWDEAEDVASRCFICHPDPNREYA